METKRRIYKDGQCDDCGRTRRVTRIAFWATGLTQWYCAECVRTYKAVLTLTRLA